MLEWFSAILSNQILGSDVLDLSFQRFIVFLSSNNFPGLDEGKIVVLFEYLVNQSPKRLYTLLNSVQGPEIHSFAEKLFPYAIKAGNVEAVRFLLQDPNAQIDVNKDISWKGHQWPPVVLSSHLQNIAMTTVLLYHKADVRAYDDRVSAYDQVLRYAISGANSDPELVPILINAGAHINVETFDEALRHKNEEVTELFVRTCAQNGYHK